MPLLFFEIPPPPKNSVTICNKIVDPSPSDRQVICRWPLHMNINFMNHALHQVYSERASYFFHFSFEQRRYTYNIAFLRRISFNFLCISTDIRVERSSLFFEYAFKMAFTDNVQRPLSNKIIRNPAAIHDIFKLFLKNKTDLLNIKNF